MTSQGISKTLGIALPLATLGWTIFLAGMMRIVSHPLQPISLALLLGELALSAISLRISEKSYRSQGGVIARFSYVLSGALFGTALLPFWIGLAFFYAR